MFVRIVWSSKPVPVHKPRGWRSVARNPRTSCDDLGLPGPDFFRMTKSLFDRPE